MVGISLTTLLDELKTVKSQVLYLLDRYPDTRNNDFYLLILWLKYFGGLGDHISFIPYDKMKKLSGKAESVRRVRAKIQNKEGLYLATEGVRKKRKDREDDFRSSIGKA